MCTLTFIPKANNDFILTSNRDEAAARETLPPEVYIANGRKLLYPKDKTAGGTWIGISDANRLICLLNGGFTAHERKPEYRMSRGIIVKELLIAENAVQKIESFDFTDIEPFTLVMADWSKSLNLYELVWDGLEKHFKPLPVENHIWSSSSLYTKEMTLQRQKWFSGFLENSRLQKNDILDFHHNAGTGDKNTDLRIDRGFLKTVSITQIEKSGSTLTMYYEDLQTEEKSVQKLT